MRQRMHGIGLLVCLGFLSGASSCRKDPPPQTDICLGDGHGGADCTLKDGSHAYRLPSQLENSFIIPDQQQAKDLMSWCYQVGSQ